MLIGVAAASGGRRLRPVADHGKELSTKSWDSRKLSRIRPLNTLKKSVIRAGFETLYFSGAHALMRPFVGGVGAILTPPMPASGQTRKGST
jgi:hypothetical protein